ncbi:MAG TPA: hypothetical protein VEA99_18100 [Gemmatimonadaceae bacterium]|nr:hypothetical protein [Gemmatimonadaceae bacterium]
MRYFFKTGEGVVQSEVLGYSIAELVELNVPQWALCRVPPSNQIWFASQALGFSGGAEQLIRAGKVTNPEFLGDCIAFDIWTANVDRNIGNIIADAAIGLDGLAELYAIDFEQAQVLNGTDFMTVGTLHSRSCWPKGALVELCRGVPFPTSMAQRIGRMRPVDLESALVEVTSELELPEIPWMDSAKRQLLSRAQRIDLLLREAWDVA